MVQPDPSVNTSVNEVDASGSSGPVRSAEALAEEMFVAASCGDASLAASLLRSADENYAAELAHPSLELARSRCQYILDRARALDDTMRQMRIDLEEDRFTSAIGRFREALCLSQGFSRLEEEVAAQAVRNAELLLPRNWRVADALLHEAAAAIPDFALPPEVAGKLERARVDELVTIAIYQADKAEFTGTTDEARQRLLALISTYPGEKRLADRLRDLNTPRQVIKRSATTMPRPAVKPPALPRDLSEDDFDWHAIKNMAAVGGATVMLGLAGFLVWRHFSAPASAPVAEMRSASRVSKSPITTVNNPPHSMPAAELGVTSTPPGPPNVPFASGANEAQAVPADEQAWELVKSSDNIPSIKAFIAAYPLSPHALRAKVRIAAIEWDKVDKNDTGALDAYLAAHPHGFYRLEAQRLISRLNARKVASIEAPPSGSSDRDAILEAVRTFRQSNAGASPSNTGSPDADTLDEPVINGDQATVRVHRSGSVEPGATFSVVRVEGKWRVVNSQ